MKGMKNMGTFMLDECLTALYEAQQHMQGYSELTSYQEIFEATNPDVAEKMKSNTEIEGKTDNAVLKAIRAVKNMIKSIISAINNFIQELTMKKAEKDAYKQFLEAAKKDPSLKNKKITVKDYRAVQAQYDEALKDIDNAIRQVKMNENTPIEDIVKKATSLLGNTAKSTSVILAADAAYKMAQSNISVAKGISAALRMDNTIMDQLEQELGKRGAKSYQKKINACTKVTMLTRLKAKLRKRSFETASDAVKSTLDDLTKLAHGNVLANPGLAKNLVKNDNTGKIIKTTAKTVGKTAAFVGKNAAAGAIDAKKSERQANRDEKRKKRLAEKGEKDKLGNSQKRTGVYAPAGSFLFGSSKKDAEKDAEKDDE